MKTKTNTKITLEKRQHTTIRWRRQNPKSFWCEECAIAAEMLATDEAAALLGTTQLAIFRQVESGKLHFIETADGALLICRNSLENKIYKTKGA